MDSGGPDGALGELAMTCLVHDRSWHAAPAGLAPLGTAPRTAPVVDQARGIAVRVLGCDRPGLRRFWAVTVLGCDADTAFRVPHRVPRGSRREPADVASAVEAGRGRGPERQTRLPPGPPPPGPLLSGPPPPGPTGASPESPARVPPSREWCPAARASGPGGL
ncbi:hypothetical protein ACFW9X_35340 [Streptomyces sp. NPDC059466]|uniref:hypothetical protein n=1 Tax=Streptomyces sp. NPDC059466 TaxID=3346843 RepID=UPI0036AD8F2A